VQSFVPLIRLLGYYFVLGTVIALFLLAFPEVMVFLPLGGSASGSIDANSFVTGQSVLVSWEPLDKALRLTLSMLGVLILMKPVTWVYMGARRRRGKEQAFVLTLLLLPLAVAGIVIIVENSLALAFSLAGIVAGVRFRLTLDDTLDAIYIFMSIGVGLAAGIGALEIAAVISIFFNFTVVMLWQLQYAEAASGNRWFAHNWVRGESVLKDLDTDENQTEKPVGSNDPL